MQILETIQGKHVILEPNENMQTLPDEITSIIGPGIQSGAVKLKKVTIEYVTETGEHYLITQNS